jgi:hypothetical protein
VGGERHASAALPSGKTRYPLYRRPGGPQSRSGGVRNISPPRGFDPRTVQPVPSRYTDRADPAHPKHSSTYILSANVVIRLSKGQISAPCGIGTRGLTQHVKYTSDYFLKILVFWLWRRVTW